MRFMAVRMLLLLVTTFVWLIQARSWLSCPPSPNSFFSNRAGSFTGPCEFDILPNLPVTQVRSGDFLKVGWPSVNQGGGFVRLALASSQYRYNSSAFNNNILKVACFGCSPDAQDTNASLSAISRCNHPCGAGGPCDGGSVQTLPESYQTAIQIPTNLPDGSYLLQWMALAGNWSLPMFSCARLEITGGDPNQQCQPWRTIPVPQCQKAAGPPAARLLRRSSLGSFCYGSSNQTVMSENIRFADTINSLCDPRLSCDLALDRSQCLRDRFDQSTKCASNVLEPDTSVISIASDDVTAIEVPVESEQPFPAGPPNTTSDRSICLDGNNSWAYWNGSAWSIEKCSQKTKCFRDQSGFSRCVMDNTFGKSRQPIDTATWIGYRVLLNGTEHEQFVIRFEISTARDFDKWQMKLKLSDAATISQIPGVSWTQQGQIVFLEQSAANIKSYSVNNQDRFKFLLVGEGRVPMIRQLLFGTRLFRPPPRRFLVRYVIKERLQLQNTFQSDIYILPDDNICRNGVQLWFDYQSQWVEKVSKSAENAALIDSLSFMQYGNTVTLTIEGWDCVSEPAIISIEGFMYAASGSQQQDSVNDQLLTIPNNFRMASIGDGAIPVPVKRYYIESML